MKRDPVYRPGDRATVLMGPMAGIECTIEKIIVRPIYSVVASGVRLHLRADQLRALDGTYRRDIPEEIR